MGFPKAPPPYLLFKAVWGQEEAVQGDKVALQEPHEQHQVDPICKLRGEAGISVSLLHHPGIDPPEATSAGRVLGEGGGNVAAALCVTWVTPQLILWNRHQTAVPPLYR